MASIKEQDARVCCNARFGRDHDRWRCVLRASAQLALRDGLCDGRLLLHGLGLEIGYAVSPNVVVLDYGSGNVRSAERALIRAGASVTVTSDTSLSENADGLVVPGVGAFEACMRGINAVQGGRTIGRRLAGGRPVLGICVGMQVLFERGREHGTDAQGLGEWPGVVDALEAPVLPHMGWNTVDVAQGSVLFAGVESERFYFVHSYAVKRWELYTHGRTTPPMVTWAEHGEPFVAAVDNGPLSAVQFHPDKSGDAGAQLLRNWVVTL